MPGIDDDTGPNPRLGATQRPEDALAEDHQKFERPRRLYGKVCLWGGWILCGSSTLFTFGWASIVTTTPLPMVPVLTALGIGLGALVVGGNELRDRPSRDTITMAARGVLALMAKVDALSRQYDDMHRTVERFGDRLDESNEVRRARYERTTDDVLKLIGERLDAFAREADERVAEEFLRGTQVALDAVKDGAPTVVPFRSRGEEYRSSN